MTEESGEEKKKKNRRSRFSVQSYVSLCKRDFTLLEIMQVSEILMRLKWLSSSELIWTFTFKKEKSIGLTRHDEQNNGQLRSESVVRRLVCHYAASEEEEEESKCLHYYHRLYRAATMRPPIERRPTQGDPTK